MKIINLQCGDWEASVLPEQAFNMIRMRYQGEPVLHEPDAPETVRSDPFLFGIPLLVPPNRLLNNEFTFNGIRYEIPYTDADGRFRMHGRLHSAAFTVIRAEKNLAVGEINVGADRYPVPFRLTVRYELAENGLRTMHTVTNIGVTAMPFAIGFHTAFESKDHFSVSIGQAWLCDEQTCLPSRLVELTEEQRRYREGMNPTGRAVDGFFTDDGRHTATVGKFLYRLSDNFTDWVVWNMGGRGTLLCLEPQSAPVNSLNMAGRYTVLDPGASETFTTELGLA